MEQDGKKKEIEILFPEMEVEGFRLRPWTWRQFVDLLPLFGRVYVSVKEKAITPKNLTDHLHELVLGHLSECPELVSRTISVPVEEIMDWETVRVLSLSVAIVSQNLERVKNFFGPGLALLNRMKSAD